ERVTIMLNMDMIGRLRKDRLEVYGIRSSRGLRRMVSLANRDSNLVLDFQWDMREDSDHFSFYDRGLPVLMLHTGLHEDYHRPGDDAEKINPAGAERVGRLLFNMLIDLADRPYISGFRQASHSESAAARRALERPLPPLPGRLGITWDLKMDAEGRGLWVTRVAAGSPAALGGIRPGDRIVRFDGRPVDRGAALRAMALAAESPVEVSLIRAPASEPIELSLQLRGDPVRLGLSWRADDAEPGSVLLTRVVPDSPAARAGLRVQDRIYQVSGQSITSSDELAHLLLDSGGPIELAVERHGRVSSVLLPPSGFAGE
ncbi:MAG: PDZ domain-containing protein, partial [Pirellulales bacterium]